MPKIPHPLVAIEATALQLLAQREHTQYELRQKLIQRAYPSADVVLVLEKLATEGWQSDARFTERYIAERAGKGYGPLKISQELQQRGISAELIENHLNACEIDWFCYLKQAYVKKFKNTPPNDFKEKAKQIRFLTYRGFELEQIYEVVP